MTMHLRTKDCSRRAFLKSSAALAAGAVLGPTPAAAEDPVEPLHETQLLLDDFIVAEMKGLRRTLHQPKKHGLIKEADGSDWDRGDVYLGNLVCRDSGGRFHMT